MGLGTMLFTAMLKADNDRRACFVQEDGPGSRSYRMIGGAPQRGTYYKIEPNRIVTRLVARTLPDIAGEETGEDEEIQRETRQKQPRVFPSRRCPV